MTLTIWERAARRYESGQKHHYDDPLHLGATVDPPRTSHGRPIGVHRSPALDVINTELVQLADGVSDRLMIFIPPQEGKSTTVSQWLPVWLLADDPTLNIGLVSYQAKAAIRWGKRVRRIITDNPQLGIVLRRDSQAADQWETTAGGGMISVGIEGGITGRPIDVLIIDDPVRGRAEAESKTYREAAWDWWESNGATRLSARGRVVLMMTRWHTDDLAGRILKEEPGEWRVVNIPAIAETADDPLGRQPGEELQSVQGRAKGWFEKLKRLRSPYVWQSVYQQAPVSAKGNLFKRDAWRYWQPGPRETGIGATLDLDGVVWQLADCMRFATVDLATSTKTSADYTVASIWAIPPNGELVLLDRFRDRVAEADHFPKMRPKFERWLTAGDVVYVEASQHSTTIAYEAGRSGIPIAKLDADADKLTRALPAAGLANQGRMWLPKNRDDILDEWIDEHADFPSAAHDDQVDTSSYAARVRAAYWSPGDSAEVVDIRRAAAAAAPEGGGIDMMTVAY